MNFNELTRRMDALEKRQKELERLMKGTGKKKATTKKVVKKKTGGKIPSELVEKKKE